MEKGDKLVCKKSVKDFNEDNVYGITDIFTINPNNPPNNIVMFGSYMNKFYVYNKPEEEAEMKYIFDYFYTNKELRKEKIKKIDGTT